MMHGTCYVLDTTGKILTGKHCTCQKECFLCSGSICASVQCTCQTDNELINNDSILYSAHHITTIRVAMFTPVTSHILHQFPKQSQFQCRLYQNYFMYNLLHASVNPFLADGT